MRYSVEGGTSHVQHGTAGVRGAARRRDGLADRGAGAAWGNTIVGYLSGASSDSLTAYPAVFRRSLAEAGYVEGQNVEIEYRWAGDQPDRLPALATELVSRKVTIL